jgi:hypothetical protein
MSQHHVPLQSHLRGPPGGPPLPANPPGSPKPGWNPGGAGPEPTPAAGPVKPTGSPLPAGLLIPGPACIVAPVGAPPGAAVPNLADGSAGGGPSTVMDTTCVPRTIARPSVRFSSTSTSAAAMLPGAAYLAFDLTRRNSSVSASTRFICCL